MAALRAQQGGLATDIAKTNKMTPMGSRHITSLMKFGNQLQWTGRMLQYNFTLPILLAAGAATKFSLDQEKAFTHVAKVYGDTQAAAAQFRAEMGLGQKAAEKLAESYEMDELKALDKAFTAISNHYGVQKKEVNEVAGAWAAAGQSGLDLAKSVEQTMQAIIIGDMNAMDATKALISIQAQYNLSTEELQQTLANLNSVENQTGASMSDLIIGFEKAAGVARSAGIETQQLAAYMAAIVPAAGSASTGGNALKTIFSRLINPTKETVQVLEAMGIEFKSMSWQSATVSEQLQIMADKFEGLKKKQQGVAASVVASRWQVNRFEILMREINSSTGYYAKALEAAKDDGESFTRMQKELNTVLESNPRKLERMMVMLQNASVEIIQPLIPHIIYLAEVVAKGTQAFADMNPETQKLVLFLALLLAAVGPVVRYMGALTTLFGVALTTVSHLAKGFELLGKGLLLPFKPIGLLIRAFGTLFMTIAGAASSGIGALISLTVGPLRKWLVDLTKMVFNSSLTKIFGAMWAGIVKLFRIGSAAAWAVEQAWHAASVTGSMVAAKARTAIAIAGATSRVRAELNAGAAVAGAAATVGSSLVAMDQASAGARSAAWDLFYSYITGLIAAANAAWWGLEAGASANMIALEASTASSRMALREAYYAWTIGMQRAYWAAYHSIEASGHATAFALESSAWNARKAAWAAFLAWQIGLARAYNAAVFGLDSGAAAATLAIESSKSAALVTMTNVTGAAVVAANVRTGSAVVATNAAAATATISIWVKFRTAVIALFMGLLKAVGVIAARLVPLLAGPWGIAIAAIIGVAYHFRDQIKQIWNNIIQYLSGESAGLSDAFGRIGDSILRLFNKLPQGVQNALVAVVTVVRDAALAVYEWFSYINPFARHSPSLVDNVTNGMTRVISEFARLSQIKQYTEAAYSEIKRFGNLTANLNVSAKKQERREDRKVLKDAGAGKALASYNRMVVILDKLNGMLKQLETRMQAQQAIVDKWQDKVDAANDALDVQQKRLDKLQATLAKYQDKLSAAQQSLNDYASAPLVGMRAMEDQIFANEMAQVRLRYAMMQMEDVVGTYDDLKEKMEAINGLQEILRGTQESLRAAGAGSEILDQYDSEIKKLEEQKGTYNETADQLNTMRLELEALQREAERLDLVKAMKFDELQYQIKQAADTSKELTFEEIMTGMAKANAEIAKYGPLVDQATAAVEKQQKKVDEATAARDRLQERLEKEQAALDAIKDKYDEVNDAISAIERTISDVTAAADKMNAALAKKKKGGADDYISPGLQNFLDAAGGDYPDPGGKGIPPRTDWSNQAADIDKWADELSQSTSDMFAQLNPFAPLKEKALKVWNWIKDRAKGAAGKIGEFFSAAFDGVDFGDSLNLDSIKDKTEGILEFLTEFASDIAKPFKWAYELLWPPVKRIGQGIWDGLKKVWEKVGPKLEEFAELWEPIGKAIENLWSIIKPVLGVIVGAMLAMLTGSLTAIGSAIGPLIESIGTVFGGIIDIVKGAIKIITGILTLDGGMMLDGIADLFKGLWGIVWGIFSGLVRTVWNLFKGFVEGIYNFIVWLGDKIGVDVPAIVDKIKSAFSPLAALAGWVWDNVLVPIYDFFVSAWEDYIKPFMRGWWAGMKEAWKNLAKVGQWVWDNVLKPVWNFFKWLWTDAVRPELARWWERIQAAWAALKKVGTWIWDNVLKPAYQMYKDYWNLHVKPELALWWERIKKVWDKLTGLGNWVKTHVMDPVKNAFTSGWRAIKEWFVENADIITKPVNTVVNSAIRGVNFLIRGLNKVADILPGIDWDIKQIPELARGGNIPQRRVGNGFITSGARAIVGEGKANHPEFVIPTDPTYRNRARALLTAAAAKIGMGSGVNPRGVAGDTAKDIAAVMRHNGSVGPDGTPRFAIGGWLSDKWGDLKGIAKAVAKIPRNAVASLMNPILDAGREKIKDIGWAPVEAPPLSAIDKLEGWVRDTNKSANSSATKADEMVTGGPRIKAALAWAKTQQGKPYRWGSAGPEGYDCSGFMSAIHNHIVGNPLHSRVGSTASFPWNGYTFGSKPTGFTIGSTPNYGGSGVGHMAGTLGGVNVESAGGVGVRVGSSARGALDPGFRTRAHLAMKQGGIALARRGQPTPVVVGDGRYDEAVVPLPYGWQSLREGAGESRTINIYGDLSFPNIKSGDDAELFLQNLENVSRD